MSWTAQTSQKHRLPHLPNAISPLTSMRSTKTISRPGMAKVIADIAHMGGDYRRNEMLYYAILLSSFRLRNQCYVFSIWHCKFHSSILYFVMYLHIRLCIVVCYSNMTFQTSVVMFCSFYLAVQSSVSHCAILHSYIIKCSNT